jgi:uncharacterized SAM-binding protein YcdF (DUF218 family)
MPTQQALILAKILWDYHHVRNELKKSECILVLGSHDLRVAERGAELFLQGWAPLLIFSGGLGNFTQGLWEEAEADRFAKVAEEMGVPRSAMLIENRSTNTGENILLTQELLKAANRNPRSFLVVQKPYMERRSFATFMKHWPDRALIVTSPEIAFEQYSTDEIPIEQVIEIMVGDLQRIKDYPAKGFQIYQEIPDAVMEAYEALVAMGYVKHMLPK